MTEKLPRLLLQLSEAGDPEILWGRRAAPHRGREFDRLLDRGVLVEEAPATDWPVCPTCECGLDVRPVQDIGGRQIAACPLDRSSDVAFQADDLQSFRINRSALVRDVAEASGFEHEPSMITHAVWRMGQIPPRRVFYIALDPAAILQPGLISAIRTADVGVPVILAGPLLPAAEQLRFREAGVDLVQLSSVLTDSSDARLALHLAALESPSPTVRLVVRSAAGTIVFDGLEIALPHQPFRLIKALANNARAENGFISSTEIETLTGREARDIIRELRKNIAAAGMGAERARSFIEMKRGRGWRLPLGRSNVLVDQ